MKTRRPKVVFGWQEVNGYMAACWRALQKRGVLDVSVVGGRPGALLADNKYSSEIMAGIDAHLFSASELRDPERMQALFQELNPDIIFVPGWSFKGLTRLTRSSKFRSCKFVMGFDTPRLDTWRQKLAWLKIGRLLARMDAVAVPGERGFQFASKLLRVPEHKIWKGLYGFDYETFSQANDLRRANSAPWPKRFLFLGRYVPVKGLDTLLKAYHQYRQSVTDPWTLTCCGTGKMEQELANREGVENLGFIQPSQLTEIFSTHGAFVLPSRLEPWGVVIAEAASSALPIVCTHACGASVELVRPFYNGLLTEADNADDLCRSLLWIHNHYADLPEMGARSQQLAHAFSAEMWAVRWEYNLQSLMS